MESLDGSREVPDEAPRPASLSNVFRVEEVRSEDDRLLYLGEPLVGPDRLEQEVWPRFREHGYEVSLTTVTESDPDPITGLEITSSRHALVAKPHSIGIDGIPWANVATLLLTVLTTLFAGALWYHVPLGENPLALLDGWPFALAVLTVLGVHESGHYVMSRYHGVQASLPYFIPMPNIFGTLGAVIRMRGRIPDRRALFDIGVAGPLAGLVAAAAVSVVGLHLDPVTVPARVLNDPNAQSFAFGSPLLLQFLSWATGQPLSYETPRAVNPVVFAGWVGMFVTFLNLIPVGQLDGGHITRAMLGGYQETLAALVPAGLFGLAGYLYAFRDVGVYPSALWGFWGLLAVAVAYAGPATPVYDEPLDRRRMAVGVLAFVLGALCFMPVPFQIMG